MTKTLVEITQEEFENNIDIMLNIVKDELTTLEKNSIKYIKYLEKEINIYELYLNYLKAKEHNYVKCYLKNNQLYYQIKPRNPMGFKIGQNKDDE